MKSLRTFPKSKDFTPNQINILRLWAQKPGIAQVASELGLSLNTVQTQLSRMRKKLGVNRTFEVYMHALENGYL